MAPSVVPLVAVALVALALRGAGAATIDSGGVKFPTMRQVFFPSPNCTLKAGDRSFTFEWRDTVCVSILNSTRNTETLLGHVRYQCDRRNSNQSLWTATVDEFAASDTICSVNTSRRIFRHEACVRQDGRIALGDFNTSYGSFFISCSGAASVFTFSRTLGTAADVLFVALATFLALRR